MSRQLNFDKRLSDEDRQWALDRGMYHQVQANDQQFRSDEDPPARSVYEQTVTTGLQGTEPSAGSDRTEVVGPNPQQVQVHTDHTGAPVDPRASGQDGGEQDESEGDKYDEMSKDELREEVDKRNEGRDNDSRILVSGTADDLRDRLREDDGSGEEPGE